MVHLLMNAKIARPADIRERLEKTLVLARVLVRMLWGVLVLKSRVLLVSSIPTKHLLLARNPPSDTTFRIWEPLNHCRFLLGLSPLALERPLLRLLLLASTVVSVPLSLSVALLANLLQRVRSFASLVAPALSNSTVGKVLVMNVPLASSPRATRQSRLARLGLLLVPNAQWVCTKAQQGRISVLNAPKTSFRMLLVLTFVTPVLMERTQITISRQGACIRLPPCLLVSRQAIQPWRLLPVPPI